MPDAPLLPSQQAHRLRLSEVERAAGIRWTPLISKAATKQLSAAYLDIFPVIHPNLFDVVDGEIRRVLRHSRHSWDGLTSALQLDRSLPATEGDGLRGADLLQALLEGLKALRAHLAVQPYWTDFETFGASSISLGLWTSKANKILEAERISWLYVDETLMPRDSQPLHAEVIAPLAAVLADDPRFGPASRSYETALRHLVAGEHASAVTAFASALQDAFAAVGAKGQSLGAQVAVAIEHKIISSYGAKLVRALADWATAARTSRGIAHGAGVSDEDDARFAHHLIGAVILRLSKTQPALPPAASVGDAD